MSEVTMKQLLEAGVHFGHQTSRWNPKMKPYIFGARNGIYIIDLQQTVRMFKDAYAFVRDLAAEGGQVLFVGTKKQAQDAIREEAERCGMFYVTNRWLGGMLTNFQTIKQSIDRLRKLDETLESPAMTEALTKKELIQIRRERDKLMASLGGIKNMRKLPDALFVVDPEEGGDRGQGGQQARHSGRRRRRHQLRSRRHRLQDPRQRRRDPRDPALLRGDRRRGDRRPRAPRGALARPAGGGRGGRDPSRTSEAAPEEMHPIGSEIG